MFENQQLWFESTDIKSMNNVLASSPGKIGSLINQYFQVVDEFNLPTRFSSAGRSLYRQVWTPGNGGIVRMISFGSAADWIVHVEYLGHADTEFLTADEIHITLPLLEFLVHTMPLREMEFPEVELMGEVAANDADY